MDMHLDTTTRNLISNYGTGVIGIDGTDYRDNVMVVNGRVIEGWFDGAPGELELHHFAPLFGRPDALADAPNVDGNDPDGDVPEICLLGTGAAHVFPPVSLIASLRARGVALEVMNTRAACRTYSVLVGEERSVAAALIQITPDA